MSTAFDQWFTDQAKVAFDSFDEAPNMSVFETIHAEIQPAPIHWIKILQIAALFLLVASSTWFVVSYQTTKQLPQTISETKPVIASPEVAVTTPIPSTKQETNPVVVVTQKPAKKVVSTQNASSFTSKQAALNDQQNWVSIMRIELPPIHTLNWNEVLEESESNVHITLVDSLNSLKSSSFLTANRIVITANDLRANRNLFSTELLLGSISSVSDQQVNAGLGYKAGAISYWNTSSSIRLGTGLAFAKNNFTIESSSSEIAAIQQEVLLNQNIEPQTAILDRTVQTLSLEIPISMQYYFSGIQQKSYFMSLGLSSQIYLQERFQESSTQFSSSSVISTTGEVLISLNQSTVNSELETDAFQRIDWGRLMNFSFGYAFSKKTQIELYLSYPLGGITSRNLEYSMTGINLKYSIN